MDAAKLSYAASLDVCETSLTYKRIEVRHKDDPTATLQRLARRKYHTNPIVSFHPSNTNFANLDRFEISQTHQQSDNSAIDGCSGLRTSSEEKIYLSGPCHIVHRTQICIPRVVDGGTFPTHQHIENRLMEVCDSADAFNGLGNMQASTTYPGRIVTSLNYQHFEIWHLKFWNNAGVFTGSEKIDASNVCGPEDFETSLMYQPIEI